MLLSGTSALRRIVYLSVGLLVAQSSRSADAQITLHPARPPANSQNQYRQQVAGEGYASGGYFDALGQTRQKPVSRGTRPLEPGSLQEAVPLASSDRDYEFQQLQREADALERQFNLIRRIVRFASPSIVHIEATKLADAGKGYASSKIEEAGAGVIVNIAGVPHVLTNRHVIHPADIRSIRLELHDGRVIRATQVWTDPATDVAVIRIDGSDLVPAQLGDSDRMEIGDFVLAVGSPFGLSHSVTYGILSAKGRRNLELGAKEIQIQDFFQTDAAINPGNSGGPLINLRGEIVGINTAIASNSGGNEGIGFSIPINMAVTVAEQLVRQGRLSRSYLGVQLENAFDIFTARRLGLSLNEGALVKVVLPESPAARSGIRVGDVILEFNGMRVENDGHLVKQVGLTPVGSKVAIVIFRDGAAHRVTTVLEPNPDL
jgi:serine protease Do